MMRHPPMVVIALAFAFFADDSIGQETALPESAKLSRDSNGNVTGVRIIGESDRNRLTVTPEAIKALSNLNLLQLSDCAITDAGLASLGNLPAIQHLWLSKTIRYGDNDRSDLTDNCIDYLTSLDTLIDLRIADSRLTEGGLKRLRAGLPQAKVSTERTGITYLNRNRH